MRCIHTTYSSALVLSLVAACSGAPPSGEQTTGHAESDLSTRGRRPHTMPAREASAGGQDGVVNGRCIAGNLTNPNNNPVMHGTVNIYLISYGFTSPWLVNLKTYITNLSESSYLAMNTATYSDSSGVTTGTIALAKDVSDFDIATAGGLANAPYSLNNGKKLTDSDISTEIQHAISFNVLPNDPNGLYVVLTDTAVSETNGTSSFCAGGPKPYCAWHHHGTIAGSDLKFAFLGDPTNCGGCEWNVGQTPHNNEADSVISTFTHELIETLTDPDLNAWYDRSTGNENGDLCNRIAGATYLTPPVFNGGGGGATADLHLGTDDYLVQMDWVIPNSSGGEAYGLPFWGNNFGYTGSPVGDWANGSYKAQCSSGQPVTGISESVDETHVHSALCGSGANWHDFQQTSSCYGLSFDPGNNMMTSVDGDWDFGFYKAECRTNEFVAGVSQTTTGQINGLLCCPGNSTVTHASCNTEVFYQTNSPSTAPPDWDNGFFKGECAAGKYVAGVSATADGVGSAHALLCCAP